MGRREGSAKAIRSRRPLKRFEEIPKRNFFKSFSLAAGGALPLCPKKKAGGNASGLFRSFFAVTD